MVAGEEPHRSVPIPQLPGAETFDLTLFEQLYQPLAPETLNHDLG